MAVEVLSSVLAPLPTARAAAVVREVFTKLPAPARTVGPALLQRLQATAPALATAVADTLAGR